MMDPDEFIINVILHGEAAVHPLVVFTHKSFADDHNMLLSFNQPIPLRVISIINKHLKGDRDLLLCQDELIDAGLAEWAKI